jgi:hypothetical protein
MAHKNDLLEFLVSGHPGSKKHKRGKSKDQKRRDARVRQTTARRGRTETVRKQRNAEEAAQGVTARPSAE